MGIAPEGQAFLSAWLEETVDHALLLLDEGGVVRGWLGAAEHLLGYPADQAIGRPVSFIFTAEDREQHLDRHELEMARRNGRSEDDRWHMRGDGTRVWMTGVVTALHRPDGSVRGFVKVMRERTDLRTQVERLETTAEQLRQARERTHEYLRTLGHEIRNNLAPIQNALNIIHRTSRDERGMAATRLADNQLDVLKRLADDLMDVVRLEAGKMQLHKTRIDLRELLASSAQSLQDEAAKREVRLDAVLPIAPLWVDADVPRLQQVVLNLLTNALKYNRRGGKVWISTSREAEDVVVRVQDTGIGISAQVLPELFELFTRAPGAEDVAPGGLGVGLALVRQLVELHGGTVQARSAGVGKGAEFSVRLPAAPAPGRESRAAAG